MAKIYVQVVMTNKLITKTLNKPSVDTDDNKDEYKLSKIEIFDSNSTFNYGNGSFMMTITKN